MKDVIYCLIIAALLVILFKVKGCDPVIDETVRDTTWLPSKTIVEHVPVPFKIQSEPVIRLVPVQVQGTDRIIYKDAPVDTAAILSAYFAKVFYSDTAKVRYGRVIIRDTLSQNRIAGRSVLGEFQFPSITTTRTITDPPKRMLFIGPDIGYGVGGSIMYKTKTDHLYNLGYMLTQHGGILSLGYKWKVSIH